jgi:hypothetical protein
VIRIELAPPLHPGKGQTIASAEGVPSVRGWTPVLDLCRKLVEAGHDPSTPAEAYRGSTLCLHIPSIGEAARLSISEPPTGNGPKFVPYAPFAWRPGTIAGDVSDEATEDSSDSDTPVLP